jgi:ubiquinone/menaquinone biosynthesis C-methylase UbiE
LRGRNANLQRKERVAEQQGWDKERAEQHARWAKMASRLSYAPFAGKIVESLAPLESGSTIVDLGTGPGILSIELHKLLPQAKIIGVDLSDDMLEIARKNADEARMSNYETRLGRAEELPIESNSVNLVVTQSSFHEWEDQRKGLSEIFRILRPGGSLILKDYNRDWLSGWRRSLLKFLLKVVGESYEDHVGMFKFTFDQVADLLREAGFDEIKGKARGLQFFGQALKR